MRGINGPSIPSLIGSTMRDKVMWISTPLSKKQTVELATSVSSPNLSIGQIKQQQICPAAAVAYFSQKLTFSQIDAAHFG